jgi:hypothetical protein
LVFSFFAFSFQGGHLGRPVQDQVKNLHPFTDPFGGKEGGEGVFKRMWNLKRR